MYVAFQPRHTDGSAVFTSLVALGEQLPPKQRRNMLQPEAALKIKTIHQCTKFMKVYVT